MNTVLSLKRKLDWPLLGIIAIGALFRFLDLDLKPPHFDEGINGWFVDQLIALGYYKYDPTNYHGPFHFYILLIFKLLFGRNLWALRLPAVLFSVGALYTTTLLRRYVGYGGAYLGALLIAVSPGMVFYSRYAIHESTLLFFSVLAVLGFFRFNEKKDRVALWQIAIGIAGMIVTKETFLLHLICFAMAAFVTNLYERIYSSAERGRDEELRVEISEQQFTRTDVYYVVGTSSLAIVCLYTGFFLNWHGLVDMLLSFAPWFHTAQKGNGHAKPFFYWLSLFATYEWAALLGLFLSPLVFAFEFSRELRILTLYAVGILFAYSLIPYKTPWCILNLIWPCLIVTGTLVTQFLKQKPKWRYWAYFGIFLLACVEGKKSYALNFRNFDNEKEPYVYVQTFRTLNDINKKIQGAVRDDPSRRDLPVQILLESSWPLPWLLGDFTRGNFAGRPVPTNPDGLVIFADYALKSTLESRLKNIYYKQTFRLRSAQSESMVYFDAKIFKKYFDGTGDAVLFEPQPIKPLKPGEGLLASYYTNEMWVGEPASQKQVGAIDFSWEESERPLPPPFGITFSGEILIPTSDPVTFSISSDDGSVLLIDGIEIVNLLGIHAQETKENTVKLSRGWHKLIFKYNDYGGGMMARLMWKLPEAGLATIGRNYFRHPDTGQEN